MKQHYNSDNTALIHISCFSGSLRLCVFEFVKKVINRPLNFICPFLAFFILFLSLLPTFSFSQINVINNGLPIINKDIDVMIYGNVTHQSNGSIANEGNFYITGDWINNNPIGNSGSIFTSGPDGWLHLEGASQIIGGNSLTHFNNLELAGSGVKQLNSVNAEIEDTLSLNDREFASGDNTVFVLATDTGAITRTDGFVSSTNDGGLSRNTLSKNTYFYPVGSSSPTVLFRPVEITPNSIAANSFKVRMANVDASMEGFDRTLKGSTIGEINPNFYHRINRTNGNSLADVTLYFDKTIDGDYDIITQWINTLQWESLGVVTASNNYGFNSLKKSGIYNFSTTPFALSTEIVSSVFVSNVFSPNGDGNNDILRVRGKGIVEMQFMIFDRWGEKVFETFDVNEGWDGTYKGEPMNLAVFVYVIKGKYKNGDIIDKRGNFTLLR